ncbi:helix-turn-helix domain-containing protein [Streptomyces sp. NPDC020490]|uniref:AraC-like ligand-binding domain-containing protein n=1 Tax=Streptomyces sp. NPDC020490 TaxID=3365078 RepID=UPI0037A6BCAB
MITVYDSDRVLPSQRVEAWAAATALSLVPTRMQITAPAEFGARLGVLRLGAVQLSEMSYARLNSQRTPRLIRQSDPEQYQIAAVLSGEQGIEQQRRQAVLRSGDLVLYDSSRPFTATASADGTRSGSLLLQFPKTLLPFPAERLAGLLAVPLPGRQGVGKLLAGMLRELAEEHRHLGPVDLARLGTTAVDLTAHLVGHLLERESGLPPETRSRSLFLQITAFVQAHLGVDGLGPEMIAAAHHLSARTVQRLFQQQGTTVSAFVREQRLGRCRRDLADPSLAHHSIRSVAARWGFPRPAEFTRTFRAATGLSPSEYREAARAVRVEAPGGVSPGEHGGSVPGQTAG